MIGLFSLCSALDGVLVPTESHYSKCTQYLHFLLQCIVALLHCNALFRWSAGYKKTSFTRCLEMQTLDIEKLFRGRSGPTNGYLSAYLMHPVMHGGPDGTLLMINLRCAAHHHTVDRLIVLYDAWHGALYRQPGACSSIFFLSSKSLQKI